MSTSSNEKGQEVMDVDNPQLGDSLHVIDIHPRPAWLAAWEHRRPQWVHEGFAEFLGVFFYCFAGFGATGAMITGIITEQPFLGNLFNVGFAYALGIVFALTVAAMSSGGHFNPAVTIAFALFRGFPWKKVPQYIFFQVLGGMVATLVVYGNYRPYILEMEAGLTAAGASAQIFSGTGPAGIFAIYHNAGIPLKWTFMNEFFVDTFIGLVIWGVLDPSNIWVSTTTGPTVIALAYACSIWGYVPAVIATNPARDLGARLGVMCIWGTKAWGGKYAAIASLTAIPATIFAALLYEIFLADTSRVVTAPMRAVIANADRHKAHKAWKYNLAVNRRRERAASRASRISGNVSDTEKPTGELKHHELA